MTTSFPKTTNSW